MHFFGNHFITDDVIICLNMLPIQHNHHRHHILPLIILGMTLIIGGFLLTKQKKMTSPATESASSSMPEISPKPSATPDELHCVDADTLNSVVGKTYSLTRETPVPAVQAVECNYEADPINDMTPSIHYVMYRTTNSAMWDQKKAEINNKAGFRRIDGKEQYFAQLNPVAELAQSDFYGKNDNFYLELTYTPIKEEVGTVLNKGVKVLDAIFANTK